MPNMSRPLSGAKEVPITLVWFAAGGPLRSRPPEADAAGVCEPAEADAG